MELIGKIDPEVVLREWRTRTLNGFLIIAAVAATAGTGMTMLDAISHPEQWPSVGLYFALSMILVGLAVFRRLDNRIRTWGILLVAYATGLATLATLGLGGSGRLYLLSLPIVALILLGVRSGIFMSGLSLLTIVIFALLAEYTDLLHFLMSERNSLSAADWLAEGSDTLMLLCVVMVLLILFYRFQQRLIAAERRTQAELRQAHALLEQHAATLEQKVEERTAELTRSNQELVMLDSVGEAMSETLDVKTVTRVIGDKVRDIFAADSAQIVLLDRNTNLIHTPYEYDKNEGGYIDYVEPFPLGTGVSSKVIASGQPLLLGTLEEEIANGAYFPPEIIAKGTGFFSQSWLGVPIIASGQTLGLIAVADARSHAFNTNHLRLLQTLSANVGATIENARLFQAEQQRAAELAIINSVQAGLASQLDMQAIYELVGDKIRDVFKANTVVLATFDLDRNLMYRHYTIERGTRYLL